MRVSLEKQQYKVDGLNMKLLGLIENNPLTKEQIASSLDILESTVRARISEMMNKQVMIKFVEGKKAYQAIITNSITKPLCVRCGSGNSYGLKELVCKNCGKVFSKEDMKIG